MLCYLGLEIYDEGRNTCVFTCVRNPHCGKGLKYNSMAVGDGYTGKFLLQYCSASWCYTCPSINTTEVVSKFWLLLNMMLLNIKLFYTWALIFFPMNQNCCNLYARIKRLHKEEQSLMGFLWQIFVGRSLNTGMMVGYEDQETTYWSLIPRTLLNFLGVQLTCVGLHPRHLAFACRLLFRGLNDTFYYLQ